MSNQDNIFIWGLANQLQLPAKTVDNQWAQMRATDYGELITTPLQGAKMNLLADEGSYYTFCNPTIGTAIADGNASGFVTTTPTFVLFNSNAVGGKSIYMDYMDWIVTTAVGTSSTNLQFAIYLDSGNRYSSGGTLITAANTNMGSSNVSNAVLHFGAVTATAANAQRQIYNEIVRTVIPVLGDKYKFRFGESAPVSTGMPLEGTLQLERPVQVGPLRIPPQCSLCIYEFGASQAAARQFTFNGGYSER